MVEHVLPVIVEALHVSRVGVVKPGVQLINNLLVDNGLKLPCKVVWIFALTKQDFKRCCNIHIDITNMKHITYMCRAL